MRLIDADALKERAIRVSTVKELGSKKHCFIKAVGTREIDRAPTVDAIPVVHARWEKYRDHFTGRHIGWICTNCSVVSHDLSNGDTPF